MTCRTPSGSQYLAKCQPTKALSLSLQDTTHTHSDTHVYLAQCSALSRSDFETIQKGSHCKMWCLKQLELQLLLRGTEIMIAVVLQHRANKIHFIYTWQPSNLKWNGIFLMKFIAMVHLLFNTFSVPSALPCVMTVLEVPHPSDCPKLPSFRFLYQLYQLCRGKKCFFVFLSVHSHCDSIWDKHTTRSQQQQRHVGSSCLSFCYYSVRQDSSQTGTGSSRQTDFY